MDILFNQLIYFAFFQSLLLLCVFLFSKKNRKNINPFLGCMVMALLLGLSGKVLNISEVLGTNFRYNAMSEFSALLFGTTLFLFTKSAIAKSTVTRRDYIHYIPGIIYFGCILFYFIIPSDLIISQRIETGELQRVIYACHAFGLIVNMMYWIASIRLFLRFRESLKNELSYALKTKFLFNFHIVIGVGLLIWLVLFTISIVGYDMTERNARPVIWLAMAFVILFIAYYGLMTPEVFKLNVLEPSQKYTQSKLSMADLDQLKKQLDQLMIEKKPYLNNKLLKAELAEMLGTSNPELARLLNENIGMNFFEYVNYYRIKEFVALANTEKAQQFTFFGLAQEAGFNSKTTFNKSFKKLMRVSPTEYFSKQNN